MAHTHYVAAVLDETHVHTAAQLREFSDRMAGVVARSMTDEALALPLWESRPFYRLAILSERRRRNILQGDPEPIGDPEYT